MVVAVVVMGKRRIAGVGKIQDGIVVAVVVFEFGVEALESGGGKNWATSRGQLSHEEQSESVGATDWFGEFGQGDGVPVFDRGHALVYVCRGVAALAALAAQRSIAIKLQRSGGRPKASEASARQGKEVAPNAPNNPISSGRAKRLRNILRSRPAAVARAR